MNMRTSLLVLPLLATVIAAAAGCAGPLTQTDSWETRSPDIAVRVRQFHDYFVDEYIFSFEVLDKQSNRWREVMKWAVDGPVPIQHHVKLVAESIVYAFGNAKYVVTTNAGRSWSMWDATKAVPQGFAITDVVMSTDGTGSMRVRRSTAENNGLAELSTTDFGVHWTLEQGVRPQ